MYLFFAFLILVSANLGRAETGDSVVIFVCEHGLAKSVVAAAHFNRLAKQKQLPFVAISRGTNPDPDIAQPAANGLRSDGIPLPTEKPAKLTSSEASKALRIVSFCDLPNDIKANHVEHWTAPAISGDYSKAKDAIVKKLQDLIIELEKNSK